jgi:hypothetical protein
LLKLKAKTDIAAQKLIDKKRLTFSIAIFPFGLMSIGSHPCVSVSTPCDNPSSTISLNPNWFPICARRSAMMTDWNHVCKTDPNWASSEVVPKRAPQRKPAKLSLHAGRNIGQGRLRMPLSTRTADSFGGKTLQREREGYPQLSRRCPFCCRRIGDGGGQMEHTGFEQVGFHFVPVDLDTRRKALPALFEHLSVVERIVDDIAIFGGQIVIFPKWRGRPRSSRRLVSSTQ